MPSALDALFILLAGALAGITTGIMGGSGVMVVVPMLTTLLGYTSQEAIGSSLLIDVIATVVTSFFYWRHGNLELRAGIWIGAGSVAGAQLGSFFADLIPSVAMGSAFGFFLLPMGLFIAIKGFGRPPVGTPSAAPSGVNTSLSDYLRAMGLGFVMGIFSGLFGAGGGVMFLLVLVLVLHYPLHKAVGTSSFIMLLTAGSGSLGYFLHGNLSTHQMATSLIAGVMTAVTAGLGSRIAHYVSEKTLSRIIGVIFAALGVMMISLQLA